MSSTTRISIADLGGVVEEYLRGWDKDVNEAIEKEAQKSCRALVNKTKATAPVGHRQKHYRDSISMKGRKTTRTCTYTWYVKGSDYRLSHLLENGHALRNGGRVEGTHFIRNAANPILEQYVKAVEEVLENG